MKTMYIWQVKAVVWDDHRAMRRTFSVVATSIEEATKIVRGMSPEFANGHIESIVSKREYFGGVK